MSLNALRMAIGYPKPGWRYAEAHAHTLRQPLGLARSASFVDQEALGVHG